MPTPNVNPVPTPNAPTAPKAPAPSIVPVDGACILNMSATIGKLATALAKAQGAFVTVEKDAENPFFKSNYATLAAIIKMIRKPLADNGISFVQSLVGTASARVMQTIIMHNSGEWLVSEMPCFGVSNKPQDVGSATTYAKRYGIQAAFGVAVADFEDDDDGNRANGNNSEKPCGPRPPMPAAK